MVGGAWVEVVHKGLGEVFVEEVFGCIVGLAEVGQVVHGQGL